MSIKKTVSNTIGCNHRCHVMMLHIFLDSRYSWSMNQNLRTTIHKILSLQHAKWKKMKLLSMIVRIIIFNKFSHNKEFINLLYIITDYHKMVVTILKVQYMQKTSKMNLRCLSKEKVLEHIRFKIKKNLESRIQSLKLALIMMMTSNRLSQERLVTSYFLITLLTKLLRILFWINKTLYSSLLQLHQS